jgi:hypothetical protein
MAQTTYHPVKNQDIEANSVTTTTFTINGVSVVTALLLASGQVVDLNGEADALILDAAQNVRIDGSSTGKMRIKISGAYDFEVLANIFRALSGSVIETNTINETTAASGVTIDGVLLKDGGAVFADAATIEIDTVNEATAAAGVTIDSVLLKDGFSTGFRQPQALTATGAITVGKHGLVTLAHATVVIAATLAAPAAGYDLVIVNNSASGTVAHTVTAAAGVTFDGTNNTATLDAPGEALHIVALSATRWFILENIGSVALSNV